VGRSGLGNQFGDILSQVFRIEQVGFLALRPWGTVRVAQIRGDRGFFGMSSTAEQTRILIVEDDASSRRSLERLFRLNGAEVASAASADEALARLHWMPHWIVLDPNLSEDQGEKVLQAIRSRELPIRVAVVTGLADRARLASLQQFQPECILIKPIHFSSLLDCLKLSGAPQPA
jgi:CheY-like chemotaxis protein